MVETDFSDKGMMVNPGKWPCWPFLPVKKRDHKMMDKNLGIMVDGRNDTQWTVYLTNMFDIPTDMDSVVKFQYESLDALLADGWVVD